MPKSKKAENAQNQRAEKWRGPKTLKMGKIKKAKTREKMSSSLALVAEAFAWAGPVQGRTVRCIGYSRIGK